MVGFQRMLRVLAPLAVICGALFAASCGGGTTPSATPTTYPSAVSQSFVLYTASQTLALSQVGTGAYVSLNYGGTTQPSPFPSAGITLGVNSYSSPPPNAIGPSSVARQKLSQGNATGYSPTGVYYYTATLSTSLPLNVFTSQILFLSPTQPVNVPYYLEIDDLTTQKWINTYPGSAVTGGAVTFGSANGYLPSVNLANVSFNGDTLLYQFYYLNGTSAPATATPAPSVSSSAAVPTPTPAVVSTTVPAGSSAAAFTFPVTAGGYVGSGVLPAGSGSGSVTVVGTSQLPAGITAGNNEFPFYVMGFSSSASVALAASPQVAIQLPSNFTSSYQILGALCTAAACPVQAQDGSVIPAYTNSGGIGTYTFATGAFPDFATLGTTPQYILAYINRSTPAGGVSSPVPIPAGGYGVINVPGVPASPVPGGPGQITSVVQIGGLSAATTATVAAQTGLFPEQSAIVPNTQTVFYALKITTSGTVTTSGFQCGAANCSIATVNLSPDVIAGASGKTYYVEQCSASNCPVVPGATPLPPTPLTLNGTQLSVSPASFGSAVTGFSLTAPVYLVFYYQ